LRCHPIDGGAGDNVDPKFIAGPNPQKGNYLADFFWRQRFAPTDFYGDRAKADLPDAKLGVLNDFPQVGTPDIKR